MAPLSRILLICGSVALFSGCDSEPDSHVVSAPPPAGPVTAATTVTTQTSTTAAPVQVVQQQPVTTTTYVTQAPPAMQQEVVLAQPGPDYKWVPGFWTWRSGSYQWVAGHWEIPPHADSVWIAPHYEPESSGGYRFYEGYWN
jgi:hypothetical protein